MKNNIFRENLIDGVNFISINDDRFKTMRISVNMMLPLKEETVSGNAILPFMLKNSCKKYPSFSKMNKRLAELYGAQVYPAVRKMGDVQVLSLCAVCIDDRYVFNSDCVSEKIIELLCDIIFNPDIVCNNFKEEVFDQEKRQLIETIEAEFNDKRSYARMRCEEIMCKNEPFGINCYGTTKQVEKLELEDVYEAWERVLKTARFEIIMVGNSISNKVCDSLRDAFSKVDRENIVNCKTSVIKSVKHVTEKTEILDVQQAKLVMGFRTGVSELDEDYLATRLMVSILGGTPHSKLFVNVREKLSLCYYCSASYDKNKGIMFVQSGVEQQNIEKAKNEILAQLDSIKTGDFTLEDIEATKLSLSNSFKSLSDSLSSIESWYLSQTFCDKLMSPEECVEEIYNINKEQIISAANKITLDTVYILKNKEN